MLNAESGMPAAYIIYGSERVVLLYGYSLLFGPYTNVQ